MEHHCPERNVNADDRLHSDDPEVSESALGVDGYSSKYSETNNSKNAAFKDAIEVYSKIIYLLMRKIDTIKSRISSVLHKANGQMFTLNKCM